MAFSVSVVIPSFNRSKSLHKALRHLENQSIKKSFEVVVVDDGSSDGTINMLQLYNAKKFDLKIVSQKNLKQGAARNNGVSNCSGSLVVFVQDDIFVSEGFLEKHLNFHKNNSDEKVVAIGNTIWTSELQSDKFHQFLDGSSAGMFPAPLFHYGSLKDGDQTDFFHFYTNNLSIKKSFFQKECFDEKFNSYGWEDIELGFRLFRRGMRLYYLEYAIGYHNHKYNFKDFLNREEKVAKNKILLIKLHPEIEEHFSFSLFKKILFTILSIKPLLLLYKMVNSEMYYYFSGKNIQRKYY